MNTLLTTAERSPRPRLAHSGWFKRWIFGLLAALTLVLAACSDGDSEPTEMSTAPDELSMDTNGAADDGARNESAPEPTPFAAQPIPVDATTDTDPLNLVIPTPTAVAATPTATPVVVNPDPTCAGPNNSGATYTVTYPAGWHTETSQWQCRIFSPAPINLPTEVEFAMEVSLYFIDKPWTQAMNDIVADYGEYWATPTITATTVDGQGANILVGAHGPGYFVDSPYRAYAVDMGNTTLIGIAREYTDGSAANSNLTANAAALDFIMSNIDLTPGTTPACSSGTFSGNLFVSASHDLDGDGGSDLVEVREDVGIANQGIIKAYMSNGDVLEGTVYVEQSAPLYELKFGDLDTNGTAEIVATLSANAAGGNSELLTIDGCNLVAPTADSTSGQPGLNNHYSVGSPHTWTCSARPNGTVGILNNWGSQNNDGTFDASYSDWDLVAGSWVLASQDTQSSVSQPFHSNPPASTTCPWDPASTSMCPASSANPTNMVGERTDAWDFDGDGTLDDVQVFTGNGTNDGWIQAVLSGGGVIEGYIAYLGTQPLGFGGFTMWHLEGSTATPQAIIVIEQGQATTSETYVVNGCQFQPAGADPVDGLPTLAYRGAAGYSINWGCVATANGGAIIETLYIDNNASTYSFKTWELSGGVWNMLTHTTELDDPNVPTVSVC